MTNNHAQLNELPVKIPRSMDCANLALSYDVDGMIEQIDTLAAQNQRYLSRIDTLEKRLAAANEEKKQMRSEIKSLKAQLAKKDIEYKKLEALNHQNEQRIEILTQQNDKDKQNILKRFDMLENEIKTLKKENHRLCEMNTALIKENAALKSALVQSELEISRLNSILNNNPLNSGVTTAQRPFHHASENPEKDEEAKTEIKSANQYNSRKKSEKPKGGQPVHKGHTRRIPTPDAEVTLSAPEVVLNNPKNFIKVGERIHYQTDLVILPVITAFVADIYKNRLFISGCG